MTEKSLLPVVLVMLLGTVIVSCKKSDSKSASRTELLAKSAWKYDTAGIDNDNNGTIDLAPPPNTVDDCERDNLIYFNADGTGTLDEGASKCESGDPQTWPFTWSFNADQTAVNSPDSVFSILGGSVRVTLLTETQLHVVQSVTKPPWGTFYVAVYLKH